MLSLSLLVLNHIVPIQKTEMYLNKLYVLRKSYHTIDSKFDMFGAFQLQIFQLESVRWHNDNQVFLVGTLKNMMNDDSILLKNH